MFNILLVFFGLLSNASAQNEDVIGYFNASEFNGKVLLTWSIKQGNTCNGVQVLRSTDSINFAPIGSINGVCGSTLEEVPYELTDVNPIKNERNYYRLSLGGIGFSWIVSAEVIDISSNNYLLRPNPISDSSELHFQNDASNTIEISIFNQSGVRVKAYSTIEEKVVLSKSDYSKGVYFFTIIDSVGDSKVTGKFLVP